MERTRLVNFFNNNQFEALDIVFVFTGANGGKSSPTFSSPDWCQREPDVLLSANVSFSISLTMTTRQTTAKLNKVGLRIKAVDA